MSDPRLTLVREGVADEALQGVAPAGSYTETMAMRCAVTSAPVRATQDPYSEQVDQLLFGEGFEVLSEHGAFAYGQTRRDGYVGYVHRTHLVSGVGEITHWVRALRTIAFSLPDYKSAALTPLSLNSLVAVEALEGAFAKVTGAGWVSVEHLSPISEVEQDFVAVAERFLGAPYLWGGRESTGVDCSGLLQAALLACGGWAPRDTDMQAPALGEAIDAADARRGDLVFWTGHVGILLDERRLLHANSHHMAVAIEPLDQVITRKLATDGAPTAFRRLSSGQ